MTSTPRERAEAAAERAAHNAEQAEAHAWAARTLVQSHEAADAYSQEEQWAARFALEHAFFARRGALAARFYANQADEACADAVREAEGREGNDPAWDEESAATDAAQEADGSAQWAELAAKQAEDATCHLGPRDC